AVFGGELEHLLRLESALIDRLLTSICSAADVADGGVQPAEIFRTRRGDDVDAAGDLFRSLDHAREAADDDVDDPVLVENLQQFVRVERPVAVRLFPVELREEALRAPLGR